MAITRQSVRICYILGMSLLQNGYQMHVDLFLSFCYLVVMDWHSLMNVKVCFFWSTKENFQIICTLLDYSNSIPDNRMVYVSRSVSWDMVAPVD